MLFFLTLLTTWYTGVDWFRGFLGMAQDPGPLNWWQVAGGLLYALAIVGILFCHEMGHFLACRHYRIQSTVPYFIPIPALFGTAGAVIRIRSPFLNRKQLFDVGIAGPIAGFCVLVPILAVGISLSHLIDPGILDQPGFMGYAFGQPLIWKGMKWLFLGNTAMPLNAHPLAMGAWLGLLATAMNLFPIGQLDGGHVVYALFGQRVHRIVSNVTLLALVAIGVITWVPTYPVFALLARLVAFRHPPPLSAGPPLGRKRALLALAAAIIFAVSFMPVPIQIVMT